MHNHHKHLMLSWEPLPLTLHHYFYIWSIMKWYFMLFSTNYSILKILFLRLYVNKVSWLFLPHLTWCMLTKYLDYFFLAFANNFHFLIVSNFHLVFYSFVIFTYESLLYAILILVACHMIRRINIKEPNIILHFLYHITKKNIKCGKLSFIMDEIFLLVLYVSLSLSYNMFHFLYHITKKHIIRGMLSFIMDEIFLLVLYVTLLKLTLHIL